ncbi:hypothetical protein N4261_11510 [Roseateles amylovorans]|uniref:Uncharacterized protein n=2 Tax=Roseateles amylovorans TaxID=2978473 RepID=A0ABY6BAC6_9BURK|nr:hypothetical protein [Roseateles amylovorans]UXH80873.1 hypothetical protein N4261_11510 [Roseateles amylovorans]
MWKIVLGFIVFAAIALFVLMKSGGNIDLTGEKHDVTGGHADSAASDAASAAMAAASAAVPVPASGASQ